MYIAYVADNKYSQYYNQTEQNQTTQQPVTQTAEQAQFTQAIQAEIAACQNTNTLLGVWNKYPNLWKNAQFTGAVTARKDQLMKNGKS